MKTASKTTKKASVKSVNVETTEKRFNPFDVLNERILAQMGKGVIPWKRPWKTLTDGYPLEAQSYLSRKPYQGINRFMLACANFETPFFLTYKQAEALGGQVKKGEKGWPIVYLRSMEKEQSDGTTKTIFIDKLSYVFNIAQVEGIEWKLPDMTPREGKPQADQLQEAEALIECYTDGPEVVYNDPQRAYYSTLTDQINMPRLEAFQTPQKFYKVLFHELLHSTGASNRLGRELQNRPGSKAYAFEELIAEIGSEALADLARFGEETIASTASYIAHYKAVIEGNAKGFAQAIREAETATNYLLGIKEVAKGAPAPEQVV